VIGATVEERGFDLSVTAGAVHRLLEAAWEVLPDIEERELVEARAGLRPGTPDNCPAVGAGSLDGLVWATGHYRNGVLLAPITGSAIARLVGGGEPEPAFEPFAPERFAKTYRLAGSPA
jgi:glycine oxidase